MKSKGRPQKIRQVEKEPKIGQFSPRGRPGRPDEIDLGLDQYEAIRLADLEGKSHFEAAESMEISRQTFGRLLQAARKKLSDALVNGKIIRIYGGKIHLKKTA